MVPLGSMSQSLAGSRMYIYMKNTRLHASHVLSWKHQCISPRSDGPYSTGSDIFSLNRGKGWYSPFLVAATTKGVVRGVPHTARLAAPTADKLVQRFAGWDQPLMSRRVRCTLAGGPLSGRTLVAGAYRPWHMHRGCSLCIPPPAGMRIEGRRGPAPSEVQATVMDQYQVSRFPSSNRMEGCQGCIPCGTQEEAGLSSTASFRGYGR